MSTVIEIIKQHLIDNGFDGLCNPHLECGCTITDLQPCGEDISMGKPGYANKAGSGIFENKET